MSALTDALTRMPLVAILRGLSPDRAAAVGDRLIAAGLELLEVPFNRPDAVDALRALVAGAGERALIGAGTVMSAAQVRDVAAAGGRFVVMPHGDPRVLDACREHALPCIPGVATPTEAFAALAAGAAALKLFPAQALPPKVVAAWKAVMPAEALLVMVGGVDSSSFEPYWAAGARGFGVGSILYRPNMSLEAIERAARDLAGAAAALRSRPPLTGN